MPVPKAEQSRRTRELIIQTGIRCLADYGYARTSLQLIAQEAGLSRGPLHYHFADKNELMAAIAEQIPHPRSPDLAKRFRAAVSPQERLMLLVDIAIETQDGPHHFAALELLMAARQDTALADAIRPFVAEGERWMDEWWAEYLKASGLTRETLLALRHAAVACLRGLALEQTAMADRGQYEAALKVFRGMMVSYFQDAMDAAAGLGSRT